MGKYKVGDRVRIVRKSEDSFWNNAMRLMLGEETTVVSTMGFGLLTLAIDPLWAWREGDLDPVDAPVLCGCGKHDVDPTKDVYQQHNEWADNPESCVGQSMATYYAKPVGISAKKTLTIESDDQYEA